MLSMLADLRESDKVQYGAKASALGELIRSGEKVPIGFALSLEFFMRFLEYNNFSYSAGDYLTYNAEICKVILKGSFSPDMERGLLKFFNCIQGMGLKYVVRSSALCEDSDNYSMAGMFDSFIKLNTFEEVKTAIKKCYASLFSDKVIAYFIKQNLNLDELKMCIIIQQFVEGCYSGVNFSVDTIDMDEEVMHINAVKGLCEDYVSGKANSAFYKIYKKCGAILEEKLPKGSNFLPKNLVNELYECTLRIEKTFGKYQDIEWTIRNKDIYILQARPITTFKEKNFEIIWSDKNEGNYTWYREGEKPLESLINEINIILGEALNRGCYDTGLEEFYTEYCIHNGYWYYRDKEMPNHKVQEQSFLSSLNKFYVKNQNIFQDVVLPELLILKEELDKYLFRDLSQREVAEFLDKSLQYMEYLAEKHQPVTHGCDYLEDFMQYCRIIQNDLSVEELYDLVFNISILNKERGFYIEMADEVNSNLVLNKIFKDCRHDELLYARLKNIPESKKLLKLIDDYIALYGICNLECDINSDYPEPILMEAPYKVIGHIRRFLKFNSDSFKRSIERSLENKKRIKSIILSQLGEEDSQEFLSKLELAEKAYLARDNHHYYFERMTRSYLRLAITEAEKVLLRNKQIQHRGDMYFLTVNELKEGLIQGRDYNKLINERKGLFNYQKKLLAPPIIGKAPVEKADYKNQNDENGIGKLREQDIILKGIPGLRKKVKGKVKIGLPVYLNEDSILVLPFTRCGELEPIVGHVIGIVVEVGSPFEHMGILARELNIPVLYNVENAMSIFRDGDEVQLDGFTGEVKIIKSEL